MGDREAPNFRFRIAFSAQPGKMGSMKFALPFAFCLLLAAFSGCALFNQMDSAQTEQNLAAAGFQVRMADTPEKQAKLAKITPYQVNMMTRNNKIYYVYADPKRNFAMIGGPKEYQKYQQINVQQNIAADQVAAAQMNQMAAMEWDDDMFLGPLWW